jgi:hypothetical protein
MLFNKSLIYQKNIYIACANEAWVEENIVIVNGAIHWNVMFFVQFMIGNWKRCRDFSNCCIPNKLGIVENLLDAIEEKEL